ncbi:hypothetical protein QCA50_019345 [Cerrena zonata]|uniref:Uncharacterized protein n=1 Tax=Cerrena zonata TaxID=2478898 RepID=A0AAW0FE22_9APHY
MEYWLRAHLKGDRFLGNIDALARIRWDRGAGGVQRIYTLCNPLDDDMLLCGEVSPEPREFVAIGVLSGESLYDFGDYNTLARKSPTAVLKTVGFFPDLDACGTRVAEVCRRLQGAARHRYATLTNSLLDSAGYPILRFPTLLRDITDVSMKLESGAPKHDLNLFAFMRLGEGESKRDWYDVALPKGEHGETVDTFDNGKWTFTPLPIYDEHFKLIMPCEYERCLKGSLVKVHITAVCQHDCGTNEQRFFFDVQSLTVMKRNVVTD